MFCRQTFSLMFEKNTGGKNTGGKEVIHTRNTTPFRGFQRFHTTKKENNTDDDSSEEVFRKSFAKKLEVMKKLEKLEVMVKEEEKMKKLEVMKQWEKKKGKMKMKQEKQAKQWDKKMGEWHMKQKKQEKQWEKKKEKSNGDGGRTPFCSYDGPFVPSSVYYIERPADLMEKMEHWEAERMAAIEEVRRGRKMGARPGCIIAAIDQQGCARTFQKHLREMMWQDEKCYRRTW